MTVAMQLGKQQIVKPGLSPAGKFSGFREKYHSPGNRFSSAAGRLWGLLLCLAALLSPAAVHAQTFQTIPALSFTMPYGPAPAGHQYRQHRRGTEIQRQRHHDDGRQLADPACGKRLLLQHAPGGHRGRHAGSEPRRRHLLR